MKKLFRSSGGAPGLHSVAMIRNEFLVSVNLTKPLLHIWPVNSHEQVQGARFVLPGRATSVAVSPDGNYCVVGIQEVIYVWQIATGRLLCTLSRHYQAVNTIKFTDDGSHFVTAGQDGLVLVWGLNTVIYEDFAQQPAPLYSFSDHALPVNDIYIGKFGMKAIMCSVSADRTCKIYDLSSGTLLLNLVFQEPLTSVQFDHLESNVFVGTAEGAIHHVNIQSPPRTKEYHVDTQKNTKNSLLGHKSTVTCLSISLDNETLLSGSADESVLVWHIKSKQIIRTIPHKGVVTNAFFMLAPKAMFNQEIKLNLTTCNFQRVVDRNENEDQVIDVLITEPLVDDSTIFYSKNSTTISNNQELESLKSEVKKLRKANKDMFNFCVNKVMTD